MAKVQRSHLIRALKWASAAAVGTQAAAITTVTLIDEMRKKRSPQSGRFPHLPPQDVVIGDNRISIFTYGREVYDAMLADIAQAKKTIFFEWFIVKADRTGHEFREALIEAAQRGVEVYIIIDTWGNTNQDPRFRRFPKIPHLHYLLFPFVRTGILTGRARDKGRDHRKILTVDSTIGYTGGYNIGTLYAHHWRDTHVRIEGPATWELEEAFASMWNDYRKRKDPVIDNLPASQWDSRIRAVANAPALNSYPIASLYLDAINHARSRVWITMGYFLPEEPMLNALITAARRGADVRVLIPEFSNHIVADWASRPLYERLLRSRVKIFLYEEAMVHAKTMTIDGRWSTVGTANLDRLSLRGNFEVNLEIFDTAFAGAMEDIFMVDLENSHELTLTMWEQRSTGARVLENILSPLAPLL